MPAVTCARCKRPINAKFTRCPFCRLDRVPDAPAAAPPESQAAPSLKRDYETIAEKARTTFQPHWSFDYSAASVLQVDTLLMAQFGPEARGPAEGEWDPGPSHLGGLIGLGVLFGEIVRRAFDGAWTEAHGAEDPFTAGVQLPGGETVFPVVAPYMRVRFGREHALWGVWTELSAKHRARVDPREAHAFLRVAAHLESRGMGLAAMPYVEHVLKLELAAALRDTATELQLRILTRARNEVATLGRQRPGKHDS